MAKITIVGHGPSGFCEVDGFIVRLATRGWQKRNVPQGRADVVCSRDKNWVKPKWLNDDFERWLVGDYEDVIRKAFSPFHPHFQKASTGLAATIIARHKYPDDDIFVVGFDAVLGGLKLRHDTKAERACLRSLGVREYGANTSPPDKVTERLA